MATQAIPQQKLLGRIHRVITPHRDQPENFYGFIRTDDGLNVYFHKTGVNGKIKPLPGELCYFLLLQNTAQGKNDRAVSIDIVRV